MSARAGARSPGSARRKGRHRARATTPTWSSGIPTREFTVDAGRRCTSATRSRPTSGAAPARARRTATFLRGQRGLRRRADIRQGRSGAPLLASRDGRVSDTAASCRRASPAWSISPPPGSAARALGASDEFFAGAENLLQPGRGVFIDGQVHRPRQVDGRLGEPPQARPGPRLVRARARRAGRRCVGFDIDTEHFLGNHPPFASIEGVRAPRGTPLAALAAHGAGPSCCRRSPLRPDAQNLFARRAARRRSRHVRLNIFPDGGVARLRVYGRVRRDWDARRALDDETRAHVPPELRRSRGASTNGGLALACSDVFFGPMNNLLLPGPRRRTWAAAGRRGAGAAPGHDWILIQLGARGTPAVDRGRHQPLQGQLPRSLLARGASTRPRRAHHRPHRRARPGVPLLPEAKLRRRHAALLRDRARARTRPITHVRLNIFPDGGVSRLRLWGARDA